MPPTVDPAIAGGFRDLMAAWPTGISVVTSTAGGTPVGCTVTALVSVSTDPPLLLVSLAAAERTLAVVRECGRFGVCALSAGQRHLGRAFATAMVCAVVDLLVGIDFRVQDGRLYGVGNSGGIYVIAIPAAPGQPVTATKVSQLAVALNGASFGVDFNPAADRLRVISDTGQNLRHNLNNDTTVVDGTLNLVAGTAARGVTAAAYTNNDLNPMTSSVGQFPLPVTDIAVSLTGV